MTGSCHYSDISEGTNSVSDKLHTQKKEENTFLLPCFFKNILKANANALSIQNTTVAT